MSETTKSDDLALLRGLVDRSQDASNELSFKIWNLYAEAAKTMDNIHERCFEMDKIISQLQHRIEEDSKQEDKTNE